MKNTNIEEKMTFIAKKWQEGVVSESEKKEFEEWYYSFCDSYLDIRKHKDAKVIKARIFRLIEHSIAVSEKKKSMSSIYNKSER